MNCSTVRIHPKYGGTNAAKAGRPAPAALLSVRPRPGKPAEGIIVWAGRTFPCALGRGGIAALKREGDGATPLGQMRLLYGFFRTGGARALKAQAMASPLPFRQARPADGWCDAPGDRNYNRPVRLPYGASCETMLRPDRLYDCVVVLDWNIRPRRRGRGSAIFLHIAREGFLPTEGCVAVSPRVMARLLPHLSPRTVLAVLR